jgi:predicted site-specific integrase-resolvase
MTTLTRYIEDGKIPALEATVIGRYEIRAWSEEDIERVAAVGLPARSRVKEAA